MGSFQKRQGGAFHVKQGRGARVPVGPGASGGDAAAVAARGDAIVARDAAAASAAAAATSATAATNAAALVGAPAGAAIDAHINSGASPAVKKGALLFDIRDYGAVAGNATATQSAITAAVAACATAGGGTVYIPAGTWVHDSTIDLGGTFTNTSTAVGAGKRSITLRGETNARNVGSILRYTGPDNQSQLRLLNSTGIKIIGLHFSAGAGFGAIKPSTVTQRAAHIDGRDMPGQTPYSQNFHIEVSGCFFTQDGTLGYNPAYTGDGSELTGANCVDIATGIGHTWVIKQNDFYRSAIAIEGVDLPNVQATQGVRVENNFFEPVRRIAHITDPGASWEIRNNSVEPLYTGAAGFIKLIRSMSNPLAGVIISGNWCGDVTGVAQGAQIEVAGGPVIIEGNLLGADKAGSASVRAVAAVTSGITLRHNRYVGLSSGVFIDWGAFTHTGWAERGGNSVPGLVLFDVGTAPAAYAYESTDSGAAPVKVFPGVMIPNAKRLTFLPVAGTPATGATASVSASDEMQVRSVVDKNVSVRLPGAATPSAFQGFRVETDNGAGSFTTRLNVTRSATQITDNLQHLGTRVGFNGATPILKPAVTGSRGGNAALASLLTQLAALGLITDSTTA